MVIMTENYWEETERKLKKQHEKIKDEWVDDFKHGKLVQFLADKAQHEKEIKRVRCEYLPTYKQIEKLNKEIAELKKKIEELEKWVDNEINRIINEAEEHRKKTHGFEGMSVYEDGMIESLQNIQIKIKELFE